MESYTVYVILNAAGKMYVGQTNNLDRRLFEHSNKLTQYTTKMKGPWRLAYKEIFDTRREAMKREKELKSGKGREYLKGLLSGK